jgi:sulfoxide reductase heme-binding subunit YedZ
MPNWGLWVSLFVFPVGYFFYSGSVGDLGPNPVEVWHHDSGQWAIWFLLATLFISPLRKSFGFSFLSWRRHLGLISASYACIHVILWMLEQGTISRMFEESFKRPHIIVGIFAMVIFLVLAVTSNNWSIRKLVHKWGFLHKSVYALLILVIAHHMMSLKTLAETEWAIQFLLIIVLFLWKGIIYKRSKI